MRIIVLALALFLGGCTTGVDRFVQAVTIGVQNPVTERELYQFENGMIVAFAGLNAYKKACVRKAIPQSCVGVISQMQVYTRQIPPALATTRHFVRVNDRVNAQIAYKALLDLMSGYKAIASANNVKVQ